MKLRINTRLRTEQRQIIRRVAITTAVSFVIVGLAVVVLHLKHPERALADTCESSYTLDWSVPATYTVSCGSVNASNWTVKGFTCFYYSPVFNTGGNIGDPAKQVDISVRINQSGNLDGNDTAWVFMYANDVIVEQYSKLGDVSAAVFSVDLTMTVPAGGTYKIVIKLKNDKTNETWQIKNGDVTTCLRPMVPLPISLSDFTAKTEPSSKVKLQWKTLSETNNDYFTVEHSTNGSSFKAVKQIKGAGNSSSANNYFYLHESPVSGINYYRLKQTDFDGTNSYSPVIKTTVSTSIRANHGFLVYPNPFKESFHVDYSADAEQEIYLLLSTLNGKPILRKRYQVDQGLNKLHFVPEIPLKTGNYLVQIESSGAIIGSSKVFCN